MKKQVNITLYEWAGKIGPFKIKTHCQDCDIHAAIIKNMIEREFKGKNVKFEIKPWLGNFFYCLARLSWHPPIIVIDNSKFYQFSHHNPLFKRGELKKEILRRLK